MVRGGMGGRKGLGPRGIEGCSEGSTRRGKNQSVVCGLVRFPYAPERRSFETSVEHFWERGQGDCWRIDERFRPSDLVLAYRRAARTIRKTLRATRRVFRRRTIGEVRLSPQLAPGSLVPHSLILFDRFIAPGHSRCHSQRRRSVEGVVRVVEKKRPREAACPLALEKGARGGNSRG